MNISHLIIDDFYDDPHQVRELALSVEYEKTREDAYYPGNNTTRGYEVSGLNEVVSGLVHEPGAAAVSGDLDFVTLGAVVEAVTHQPLDVFCQERIFGPLGMRDTFFVRLGDGEPGLPDAVRRRVAATENCPWRGDPPPRPARAGSTWRACRAARKCVRDRRRRAADRRPPPRRRPTR